MSKLHFNRRDVVKAGLAFSASTVCGAAEEKILSKPIPVSGEALPVIGLGTWRVFDVWGLWWEINKRRAIVDRMIERGATLIDSSPQYEPAEEILGDVIEPDNRRSDLFIATKVWTDGKAAGESQMMTSSELMHAEIIDLMQVHNLRDTDTHMATIREWQEAGRVRYNGITDWQASAHEDMQAAMQKYKPQFVQINYSVGEREAEQRLLPMAQDLGIAVLINRPFMHGRLFPAVKNLPLPEWATGFAESWGQFFLKFIISHPAVTCVIPGTSDLDHLEDNLNAGIGRMPDEAMRARMASYFDDL
jgi:diketogulonate reductase-like aldo/keto reductase